MQRLKHFEWVELTCYLLYLFFVHSFFLFLWSAHQVRIEKFIFYGLRYAYYSLSLTQTYRRTCTLFFFGFSHSFWLFGSKHIRRKSRILEKTTTINYRLIRKKLLRWRWYAFLRKRLTFTITASIATNRWDSILSVFLSFLLDFYRGFSFIIVTRSVSERAKIYILHAFSCSCFLFRLQFRWTSCSYFISSISALVPLPIPSHVFIYWVLSHANGKIWTLEWAIDTRKR